MAETDILNPTPTHPLNPDYSFQRKRPVTHLTQKASQGPPYFREITDVGHSFVLSWIDRPHSAARALKHYYEQYRDGFFTYVDHEDDGRHYVGRFTTPVEPMPTAHGKWTVQQVQFDEVPTVAMVIYPSRWDLDAVWRLARNDFGDRMVAAQSGAWALNAVAGTRSAVAFQNAGTNTSDTAAYVYMGYGFQFWGRKASSLGVANLLLDGALVDTIDFYAAASQPSAALSTQLKVPLGIHVVQLVATNTKNGASGGSSIEWDALRVMR